MSINRTLAHRSLTALLVLVYVFGILLLQAIFRASAGEASQLFIVLSTLVASTLLEPPRRRIQTLMNRQFHNQES